LLLRRFSLRQQGLREKPSLLSASAIVAAATFQPIPMGAHPHTNAAPSAAVQLIDVVGFEARLAIIGGAGSEAHALGM
jgi:hypothetical protein